MNRFCGWLIILLVAACSVPEDRIDRSALAKEMRGRKLKRVTDAQIIGLAAEEGAKIVSRLEPLLIIPADGNCDAIRINGLLQSEIVSEYQFICREEPDMHPKTLEVWRAYCHNVEQNIAIGENIQKLGTEQLLYTKPLVREGKLIGMWSIVLDKKEMIRRL